MRTAQPSAATPASKFHSSFSGRGSSYPKRMEIPTSLEMATVVVKLWVALPKKKRRYVCNGRIFSRHQRPRSHIKTVLKMVKPHQSCKLPFGELNTNFISWGPYETTTHLDSAFIFIEVLCVLSSASALFSHCSLYKLMRPTQVAKST